VHAYARAYAFAELTNRYTKAHLRLSRALSELGSFREASSHLAAASTRVAALISSGAFDDRGGQSGVGGSRSGGGASSGASRGGSSGGSSGGNSGGTSSVGGEVGRDLRQAGLVLEALEEEAARVGSLHARLDEGLHLVNEGKVLTKQTCASRSSASPSPHVAHRKPASCIVTRHPCTTPSLERHRLNAIA